MSAVTMQREQLADCRDEAAPLLVAHWEEIAHWKDIDLSVDWPTYEQIEALGGLRIYTLRETGVLRGYAVFMVRAALHYSRSVQAVQDVLYLDPSLRGRMLGARFIVWCDRQLANEGVQVVSHHIKAAHDFGPLLKRLGYEHVEHIWQRRLDAPDRR